jgi:hypothetical protein
LERAKAFDKRIPNGLATWSLGDEHRLGRIAACMVFYCLAAGNY